MNWKKIVRLLLLAVGYFFLGFGVYIGIFYLTGGLLGFIDFFIGIIVPLIAAYLLLLYPIIVIAMVRLHKKRGKTRFVPVIVGIIVIATLLLPFFGIPQTIAEADSEFETAFGSNYLDKIPASLKAKFQAKPFNLGDLYHPSENFECNFTEDCGPYLTVPGYNDSFYFDYYCPKSGKGPFPTIINIHGGAWVLGNKGMQNSPQLSRLLAQQGYVVFDIQYGLCKVSEDTFFGKIIPQAQSTLGREPQNKSYTIPEMAIQILGNFTDYLVDHATEYKVNLSCVYVMGRSAGAHLTGLFFGYNSVYKDIFNHSIKLKGLVLFYCPVNLTAMALLAANTTVFGATFEQLIGGTLEDNLSLLNEVSPIYLADQSAPPCLILHGHYDSLPISDAYKLEERLESFNRPAILVTFPFQAHAFDLFFTAPGGQVSTYYVERFLAATQYIDV